jgi:hypothetical protein
VRKKNAFCVCRFILKTGYFTKTGSGQRWEALKGRDVSAGHRDVWSEVNDNINTQQERHARIVTPAADLTSATGAQNKNAFLAPFHTQGDHFAKTGSGQTQENWETRRFSLCRSGQHRGVVDKRRQSAYRPLCGDRAK